MAALEVVKKGTMMARYFSTGKKKNDRLFWVDTKEAQLMWGKDKKKSSKDARVMQVVKWLVCLCIVAVPLDSKLR